MKGNFFLEDTLLNAPSEISVVKQIKASYSYSYSIEINDHHRLRLLLSNINVIKSLVTRNHLTRNENYNKN